MRVLCEEYPVTNLGRVSKIQGLCGHVPCGRGHVKNLQSPFSSSAFAFASSALVKEVRPFTICINYI